MSLSRAEEVALLTDDELGEFLAPLSQDEIEELLRDWSFIGRPEQLCPPGIWRWWMVCTGRGWGKNRTGAEWVVDRCEQFAKHGALHTIGLLNRSFDHVRRLQIEGESGLANVCARRGHVLEHAPTAITGRIGVKRDDGTMHWSTFQVHTADDPDRVRGENFHTLWCDELASWRMKVDAEGKTAWTHADLGLRALCPGGLRPQGVVTTTPKPVPLVKDLLDSKMGVTVFSRGSMLDNVVNLDGSYVETMLGMYAGTRLGRQELDGLLIGDAVGALWVQANIDRYRKSEYIAHDLAQWRANGYPTLERRVVGVDPPGETQNAECGIIVMGLASQPRSRREVYTLDDRSVTPTPADPLVAERWALAAVEAYHAWDCAEMALEVNHGGDSMRALVHAVDPLVNVVKVRASEGKLTRAESAAALAAQGRDHHCGDFPELEAQLTNWVPTSKLPSPDRLDAKVWAGKALEPLVHAAAVEVATVQDTRPLVT